MTERRPRGTSTGSWVDQQIRDAEARGEFDDLPGRGRPIADIDKPWDAGRWARDLARREGLSTRAMLPPSLAMRAEHEELPEVLAAQPTERRVRELVLDFNQRLRQAKLAHLGGPPFLVSSVDVEEAVAAWRARRDPGPSAHERRKVPDVPDGPARRRRWWRR